MESKGEGGSSPPKRKRRRPRRGKRKAVAGPEVPGTALETKPVIDPDKPAEQPLSPRERAEMKEHLRFLSAHRKVLRIKVNAAEDLLINGARDPEHRGVCLHLLGKVDRACVNAALAREPAPEARTRLLEGVVRFSPDVAIVLLYLESLRASGSPEEAAGALSIALRRLDFARVSSAQMRRVLELAATSFGERALPQVVIGLLQNRRFRSTFDDSVSELPAPLASVYLPVRAAHAAVFEGEKTAVADATLARGLDLLLAAPDKLLRAHPEAARKRLFELSLTIATASTHADRALATLLASFAEDSPNFKHLSISQARQLLRAHRDADARRLLERLRTHHPRFELPARWLKALGAEHRDRVALIPAHSKGRARVAGGVQVSNGLWLDTQRPVWVYLGAPRDADRFERAAEIHSRALLPGVAPLLAMGNDLERGPYLAVASVGAPAADAWTRRELDAAGVRDRCVAGLELLSALARFGIALPDLAARRLLVAGTAQIWLGNFLDARPADVSEASDAHLELGRRWSGALVRRLPPAEQPPSLLRAIDSVRDLPALARALLAY